MWRKVTAWLCLLNLLPACLSQLHPGTRRVPVPRSSGCPSTRVEHAASNVSYVYRMSAERPNVQYPKYCGGIDIRFNDPCRWAYGEAQLTAAHFTGLCKGATRTIHWHDGADEWGYVHKGKIETYVASPDGLPWPSSTNVLTQHGVWYFPMSWLHGLVCLTPEAEGGCEISIIFSGPVSVPIDNHNLDTTLAQAPDDVAAQALGVETSVYKKMVSSFRGSAGSAAHPVNAKPESSPLVTMTAHCDPECPVALQTTAAPAGVEAASVERMVLLEGDVKLYQIRTTQFPFAETMSQERTELPPNGIRPIVWVTNADALLVVTSGHITVSLQGGLAGSGNPGVAHLVYTEKHLSPGDLAYFPVGRAYWFKESTGNANASAITVFNVGSWQSVEAKQSLAQMPPWAVASNLHQSDRSGSSREIITKRRRLISPPPHGSNVRL